MRRLRSKTSLLATAAAILAFGLAPTTACAQLTGTTTFNFLSGDYSAQAIFAIDSGKLRIRLSNTSEAAAANATNADVLTAVFFDIATTDPDFGLTKDSIALGPRFDGGGTSTFVDGGLPSSESLGQQWAFKAGVPHTPSGHTFDYGASAVGFGVFGPSNKFVSGGSPLDGVNFGLIGRNATGSGSPATDPQIWDTVDIFLNLVNLDSAATFSINLVRFQYGSNFVETGGPPGGGGTVPEPAFYQLAALLGLGGAGLLRALRKGHKA